MLSPDRPSIAPADNAAAPARHKALRLAAALVLLVVAVSGVVVARVWPHQLGAGLAATMAAARALGAAGWLAAALVQVVIALCGILPASVGALAAGVLYGVIPGFVLSGLGTLVGAALAFLLTRSLFRPLVARVLARRPRIDRLDDAVARDGWRLVCLLRISPIMPFAITSYALGLTSLRLQDYMLCTLASVPSLLGYVILGDLAGSGVGSLATPGAQPLRWALLAVAIVATAILTLRLGSIVTQVMRVPTLPPPTASADADAALPARSAR